MFIFSEYEESFDVHLEETGEQRTVVIFENNYYVEGEFEVELCDMIDNDLDGFLDVLSEKLIGSICAQSINYSLSAVTGNATVRMSVNCLLEKDEFTGFVEQLQEDYRTVCILCGEQIFTPTYHAYGDGFVGEECCWDSENDDD